MFIHFFLLSTVIPVFCTLWCQINFIPLINFRKFFQILEICRTKLHYHFFLTQEKFIETQNGKSTFLIHLRLP